MEIPEGVTVLLAGVFRGCNSLETVELPSTLEEIGDEAFYDCKSLETIHFPTSLERIGVYAFAECDALRDVVLPESLETICEGTFSNCDNLTDISLPDNLYAIEAYAFENCGELVEIRLPDSLEFLGYRAFAGCIRLAEINYPMSLNEVEGELFADCTDLVSMEIPEGVTVLLAGIFRGCNSLETVGLPSSLVEIGDEAFSDCKSLETIHFPSSLERIGAYAFAECDVLRDVVLPEGLERIGEGAFFGCDGLKNVSLPEGLLTIEACAFESCTNLREIRLPDSVEVLGYRAFADCIRLSQANYPRNLKVSEGGVFAGCKALESVEIAEGVTELQNEVFYGCDKLIKISLPSTLKAIGNGAFAYCSDLEQIILPDQLEQIGKYAFQECTSLERIEIPSGVSTIKADTFEGCVTLSNVLLHNGLVSIEADVFAGCSDLEAILLPDTVKYVGDWAFGECKNLEAVWFPEGLESIGWQAFVNCKDLTEISIPNSVTFIDVEAFAGIRNLVFRCDLHSYAATYAIDNGIAIQAFNGGSSSDIYELDIQNSYYEVNYDGISASGNLSMVAKYVFKDESYAEPTQLIFSIPESVELLEQTLTINGKLCTEYEIDEYERLLYIPVSEQEGVVRFSLKPVTYSMITSYVRIAFHDREGRYHEEVVGTVYADLPILNISAQAETSESTVDVSGTTLPGNIVDLYVNGVKTATVRGNRVGKYSAALELPERSNNKRYTIRAETTDAAGAAISAETVVTYVEGAPVLTEFIMEHYGQSFRMEDILGLKPVVTFNPAEEFRFTIKFDVYSGIERVFVVSTRNNVSKYLEAVWNESAQAFIAEGFFDTTDPNFAPGVISIEYVRTSEKISFDSGFDFTSVENKNQVPEEWQNADVTVNENNNGESDVLIELEDGSASIHIVTEQKERPSGLTVENAESYGYTEVIDDYGHSVYILSTIGHDGSYTFDVWDWTEDVFVSQMIEFYAEPVPGLSEVLTFKDFADVFLSGVTDDLMYAQMQNDIINSSTMSTLQKEEALAALENARQMNVALTVLRAAGLVAGIAATATFGPVGGFVCAVGLEYLDEFLDNMQGLVMCNARNKRYHLLLGFSWAIDPSGYVYDTVTGERISGVTVTAYWIPYDEEDEDFWEQAPPEDEYGEFWDASEYSQLNSLTTDHEGRYAWDVPEGWWRVECVMEGYETVWSEWLPVPPPQTEVNIGMTPLATVKYGDVNGDNLINGRDVIMLRQYLAGWAVSVDSTGADVDGSGRVNGLDMVLLRQYIAGWDVTLGPHSDL